MGLASDTKETREPGRATGPIQVLHVDDDPAFGRLTATHLEREYARLSVETATSASDGLDRLRREEFDCVVADYSMPGRNGVDFLEAVREKYPELPFILFTGKGSEEVASEAISAGVTDYLQKGGGTDQYALLANRIRNAVDRTVARREHRRHLSAIETAREGISILDEDGRFVYMNRAYADLFGYDPGEMLGEHWTVMYDEQEAREVEEEILPVLEETGYWRGETTGTLPDGETVAVDRTLATTDNGEYVCIVRDITDQQEAARELRKERKFVDQALDTLDDLFYVVGEKGELIRWNERVLEVTGYTDEEIADVRATEFFPEDERERVRKAIEETLTAGRAIIQADLLTAEGDRVPYEFTGRRLSTAETDLVGLVGVGRDVRERERRQRELERKNERLDEFTRIISHDLRNPLSVASGRIELAREECDSEHLTAAANAIERSQALVEDVRTIAREGGRADAVESVALADLVETCWQTVETDGARLVVDADRRIRADRSRLRQLLENLIGNSVEHSSTGSRAPPDDVVEGTSASDQRPTGTDDAVEHGGEGVTVTFGETGDGFYVADEGPGIPEDERERVFEPGYSTAAGGTGFGLSIVKRIVEQHGWDIRVVESDAGGARFEITGVEFVE